MLCFGFSYGQKNKKQLQKKKLAIEKQIKENNALLKSIKVKEKNTVTGLKVLSNKIELRKGLILNINQQIDEINTEIQNKELEVQNTQSEISDLKKEYAKIIVSTYRNKSKYDKLMYVLASDDINQAYKRLRFLQQYSEFRLQQASTLTVTNEELSEKIRLLKISKEEKVALLTSENQETKTLALEKNEQQKTIKNLKQKSSKIKQRIAKKKKEINSINKAIAKAIAEEIKAREAAKKAGKKGSKIDIKLNTAFEKNTGKLPWPVDNGFISGNYGKQAHETERNVFMDNPGIYFTSKKGTSARAVFSGTVSSILVIQGAGNTVIVQHGNYRSVYSNLGKVFIKKGDVLETGQKIGSIITNEDHSAVFLFSIWKGGNKLNPKPWLRRSL